MKECPFCNFDNKEDVNACVNCGAELSKQNHQKTKVELINLNGDDVIVFSKAGIIGREGNITSQTLKADLTISRHHIEVSHTSDGVWFVEHIGKNNPALNGIQLYYGDKLKLNDDNLLSLGNQLYKVHIKDIKYRYIIKCPICKKVYNVNAIDEKIKFCVVCDDADKFKIASINAEVIEEDVD